MAIKPALMLYNTLSREKEPFAPLEGDLARVYSCGPTVYDYAHIGNLRQYVFMDTLRRVLRRNGCRLKHVMNITDVGHLVSDSDTGPDKMVKGAQEQRMAPYEISAKYTKAFMDDAAALGIESPEIIAKATEHIPQMLDFVERLVEKGYGYEISDGIYFDISKFERYGRLSRASLDDNLAGARVGVNPEKRSPADFALWIKAPKEHLLQWPSKWGMGYPGWHIECSAMALHYLGEVFDIHTGGVDHIPVHHENEIAQSDALVGRQAVMRWMHGEFLTVDNGKMSKSLRNTYTVADLRERGFEPLAFRYFCLNAHYRSKLNFTWDGLKSAAVSYRRFLEGALLHRDALPGGPAAAAAEPAAGVAGIGPEAEAASAAARHKAEFDAAANDDLNIPKALGIAWNAVRYPAKSRAIYSLLLDMDTVLGLGIGKAAPQRAQPQEDGGIPDGAAALLEERQAARAAKDWKRADEIRAALKEMGFSVIDAKDGQRLERA
ncbi:MAG: cysteine--tRNA ligase [Clostridiales bacterium]|jgi:cysteinyl-tRNA synthetase|nr:cysteine--tRNA ligase [Clostridiales bacterium]